ncbi:restriction endonuclease subunit S [Vibrio cholerae]|nr:restriction endonuclease subunit S [Vibrio cholerae]
MTGRYKAYPEYKDSGVEWVGKIPSHWGLKKLKYLAPLISEKAKGKTNPIALEHIQSWTGKLISTDSKFDGDGTKFKAGDILFGKLRPYLAKVYLTEEDGEAIGDFHVMRPINSSYGKFLKSLMLTTDYISTVDASTYGAKMPRASWDFTSNIQLPFCSETEAEKITNFLDHETAKIDTLIAKQEMLIELLKEKRQAVISHAVTKGLNPNVPMKDSGVEWLGEVPEHWSIKQIKHFFILQRGHDLASTQFKQGSYPVYGSNGVIGYHSEYTTKAPSITVGRSGSVGEVNYVKSDFWAHNTSLFLKSSRNGDIKYIYYFLLSMDLKSLAAGSAVGSLDRNNIHSRYMAVPSLVEQQSIVTYLEEQLKRFGLLTEKANDIVKLLKERKTALISAAVTGKIDVRHFVAEQEQPQGVQG